MNFELVIFILIEIFKKHFKKVQIFTVSKLQVLTYQNNPNTSKKYEKLKVLF